MSRRELLRMATGGAAAAAAIPWLAACGSSPSSSSGKTQKNVNMTFLHFFTGTLWTGSFEHLVSQFEQENPHIKWVGIPVVYANLEQKYLTLAAGGQPPDGTSLDNTELPSVAARHLLADLDSYAKNDHFDLGNFYPARLNNGRYQGKLYGMPIDMGSSAIYYNKDLLDQAGVKYPDASWSYEDYRSAALKLTNDKAGKHPGEDGFDAGDIRQYGLAFDVSTYRYYYAYTGYNGAQYFNKKVSKLELGDEKGQASLSWWQNLITKDHVSPTAAVQTSISNGGALYPFTSGVYAMEFAWIGLIAYLHQAGVKTTHWDVAPLPRTPTAKYEVGGQTFVITTGAKNPDAAWSWIKYMTGDQAQKYLGVNGVWFPAQKRFAKFGWPKDHQPEHFLDAFYDQINADGLAEWWFTPQWPQWQDTMDSDLSDLFSGLKTPRQTASAIQSSIGSDVASWRQSNGAGG
jgi:multiple sugar transport system substrate-binding protein